MLPRPHGRPHLLRTSTCRRARPAARGKEVPNIISCWLCMVGAALALGLGWCWRSGWGHFSSLVTTRARFPRFPTRVRAQPSCLPASAALEQRQVALDLRERLDRGLQHFERFLGDASHLLSGGSVGVWLCSAVLGDARQLLNPMQLRSCACVSENVYLDMYMCVCTRLCVCATILRQLERNTIVLLQETHWTDAAVAHWVGL